MSLVSPQSALALANLSDEDFAVFVAKNPELFGRRSADETPFLKPQVKQTSVRSYAAVVKNVAEGPDMPSDSPLDLSCKQSVPQTPDASCSRAVTRGEPQHVIWTVKQNRVAQEVMKEVRRYNAIPNPGTFDCMVPDELEGMSLEKMRKINDAAEEKAADVRKTSVLLLPQVPVSPKGQQPVPPPILADAPKKLMTTKTVSSKERVRVNLFGTTKLSQRPSVIVAGPRVAQRQILKPLEFELTFNPTIHSTPRRDKSGFKRQAVTPRTPEQENKRVDQKTTPSGPSRASHSRTKSKSSVNKRSGCPVTPQKDGTKKMASFPTPTRLSGSRFGKNQSAQSM